MTLYARTKSRQTPESTVVLLRKLAKAAISADPS